MAQVMIGSGFVLETADRQSEPRHFVALPPFTPTRWTGPVSGWNDYALMWGPAIWPIEEGLWE